MPTPQMSLNAALNVLGYHSLPTGAFDANGNVALPPDFAVPPGWTETVGRVTQSPEFGTLLKILGTLTVPGTDWHCWRVAISFHNGTLRVLIVRAIQSAGSNQTVALNWSGNLWSRVLVPLKSYAGQRKLIPPGLADAVAKVIGAVTGSSYWDRPISDDKARAARDYRKWQVGSALGLVQSFVELINGISISSKVLTTMLWFNSENGSIPGPQVEWSPLHQLYDGSGIRAVHYWWNSAWDTRKPYTYPFVYGGKLKRRGWGVTDVAHQPWDLAGACYPNYNWPDLDLAGSPSNPTRYRCRRVRNDDGTWETICDEVPSALSSIAPQAESDAQTAYADALTGLDKPIGWLGTPDMTGRGVPDPADVDPALRTTDAASLPLLMAHLLPEQGGELIGPGEIVDGLWRPLPEIEPNVPPTIWLPATGAVLDADRSGAGWQPIADLPAIVLVPAKELSDDGKD